MKFNKIDLILGWIRMRQFDNKNNETEKKTDTELRFVGRWLKVERMKNSL